MTATPAGRATPARRTRRRVGGVVGVVLAVSFQGLVGVGPAGADPVYPSRDEVAGAQTKAQQTRAAADRLTASITAADARLEALRVTSARAAEAYNAANAKLAAAKASAASAEKAATSAQRQLHTERAELGQFAAASYRSGGDMAQVGALLSADGPTTLLDRANTINVLSTQRDYVLARVESARVVSELLADQSASALATVSAATASVKAAQQRAAASEASQAGAVRALQTEQTTLRNQLRALDADAVRLAEQRAAGIRARQAAEAEAAARAAARAAEAAQNSGGGGGGGGGSSTGGSGGGGGGGGAVNAPAGTGRSTAAQGRAAVAWAKTKLGTDYQWGGNGPRYDCSGLTQGAWAAAGISILRVAADQYATTRKISTDELRPGDLLFYGDKSDYRTIHHVGMYVGNGQMIEAPYTGAQVRYRSIWRADLVGASRP